MAFPPRLFESGSFYHVYNRGNRKQQIFYGYKDYQRFLDKVTKYSEKFNVKIIAFCLMPNHFHFLVQQSPGNAGISKFVSDLCNSYSKYFNTKYETVGSLFQGRFKAKWVEKDDYLIHLSRYIHLNLVELFLPGKNIVENLFSYKWSSLPSYLSLNNPIEFVNREVILGYFSEKNPVEDYKKFVISNIKILTDPEIGHLTFDEN